ncbi:MAG: N-acetyltransferase family protein [Marinibacterium sp.]
MTIKLREATQQDAPAIADILSDWIDQTDWMVRVHTRAEDRGFGAFLIEKTQVTVAEAVTEPRAVCGFLSLQPPHIQALYLAPDARGQGVGKALLDRAKTGHDRLELWAFQANLGARRFYEREGFVEVERTDGAGNDEKLPDIRMTWTKGQTDEC